MRMQADYPGFRLMTPLGSDRQALVNMTTSTARKAGRMLELAAAVHPAAVKPWGMMAVIDLHDCDRSQLADPDVIRRFVPEVIDAIDMVPHGPLHLERFGDGELEGWSAMQFIETSSITVHADEFGCRCFVDVFSCRPFDPDVAAAIAVAHFGGRPTLRVLQR
jgi:S-adenosylmethionine/arginine decarboxylase-like enzyme